MPISFDIDARVPRLVRVPRLQVLHLGVPERDQLAVAAIVRADGKNQHAVAVPVEHVGDAQHRSASVLVSVDEDD